MSLITIRNGNRKMSDKYPKVYAEKLLYMKEGQYSPNHFHWYKTEDIINRGGNILISVYNSLPDESIGKESDVTVHCDGRTYTVPAGTQVKLTPGESIHIQVKASISSSICITISRSNLVRVLSCSARAASATMIIPTTASIHPWVASQKSRRMKRRTACSATSIRQ